MQDESVSYLMRVCFETKHLLSLFPYIYMPVEVSDETVKDEGTIKAYMPNFSARDVLSSREGCSLCS